MRLGDISDIPYLPSSVYVTVYADNGNNLQKSVITCGMMILAQLSYKTHRKISLQLEVFGKEAFDSYRTFLLMSVKDPAFMDISPMPYSASGSALNPLIQFASDWNRNYYTGTQSQRLAVDAAISPNDGSLYGNLNLTGPAGSEGSGWTLNV